MKRLAFFKISLWKKKIKKGRKKSVALIRKLNLPAAALLRNKLSSASRTITSHCFPGIKSNFSKPKGPNLNIMPQQRQEMAMGNECMLGSCGGQKPGSHTGEEKGAKAVGEQGKSQTGERHRNAGHQKTLNGK